MELIIGKSYAICTHGDIEMVRYTGENKSPCIDEEQIYWGIRECGQSKSFYLSQVTDKVPEISKERFLHNTLLDGEPYEFKVSDFNTKIIGRFVRGVEIYESSLSIIRGDGKVLQTYSLDRIVSINHLSGRNFISLNKYTKGI